MPTPKPTDRTYIVLSRAWYASANRRTDGVIDDIHLSVGDGEIALELHRLPNNALAWRLAAFDDAWSVLAAEPLLLGELARIAGSDNLSHDAIEGALQRCGFRDATPTSVPRR